MFKVILLALSLCLPVFAQKKVREAAMFPSIPALGTGEFLSCGVAMRTDTIAYSYPVNVSGLSKASIYISGMDSAYCVIWGQLGGFSLADTSIWFKSRTDTIKASGYFKLDSMLGGLSSVRFEILRKVDSGIKIIFSGKTK